MELQNLNQSPLSVQVQQAQRTSDELSKQEVRKSGWKKYALLIVVFVLCALGLFLIFKGLTGDAEVAPSPASELTSPTKVATPSPTPSAEVDRKSVTVRVLNGTGIPKEGSFLQTKLSDLGYTKSETGNADSSSNTDATVTFSSKLPKEVTDEITELLKSIYKKVVVKNASGPSIDVVVVTGLRSGQTPVATSTPKASATPSASASATPSPTPTPTP